MATEASRRERIGKALEAHVGDETHRLPWRDGYETFPVIQAPLDSIVLRHRSHRIRAHVESSDKAELLQSDPFSDEAQDEIARILKSLDGYDDLRENLRDTEQRVPGVITREGLVVNGNRRAVALREIGRDFIRVAVLPADAGNVEIDQLELKLQMQRELREEYTFTNELLFVKDLATMHNHSPERIARDLAWAVSDDAKELRKGVAEVERHLRMLHYIREVQRLTGSRAPLTFFDDKRQSLIELDGELQSLGDDEAARSRVRDMRMVGMLVGQGYKPLRQIDAEFVDDFLLEVLKEDDLYGPYAETLTTASGGQHETPSGVDVLDALGDFESDDRSPRPLLEFVAEAFREGKARLPGSEFTVERDALQHNLGVVVAEAADNARETRRQFDDLSAPTSYARQSRQKLKRAKETYERARHSAEFDVGKFRYQVRKLAQEVDELSSQLD